MRGGPDRLEAAAERGNWRDVRAATRAGYDTRSRAEEAGDTSVFFFHAERHEEPRGRSIFDFTRPKALIYANAPGSPLVLVGAMWSTRDGEVGPTPAGPILRWHSHVVCKAGKKRGLKPPASGVCPPGSRLTQGASEMLHVWFTKRPAQRIRDQRAEARALPRRVPPARRLQAALAGAESPEILLALFLRELTRRVAASRLSASASSSSRPPQIWHSYRRTVPSTPPV